MNFTSHSQAGQDKFIVDVLGGMRDGVFIDCGCNHPIEKSNTYALENEFGWRGLLIDNDENCVNLCRATRSPNSKSWFADGTKSDWAYGLGSAMSIFGYHPCRDVIDYLSLDCDIATLDTLKPIMEELNHGRKIRAITLEHDAYRFGEGPRNEMLAILNNHGYDILCADVMDQGLSFEIWAVNPALVDMARAEKFRRSTPTEWKEFWR